jgi:CheY-like chemotaxis protein
LPEAASEPATPEATPEQEVKAPASQKWEEAKKVLVLDDEPELLKVYKKIIGRLPSRPEVRIEENAAHALAILDAEPFDLFITDLRMPKIDGFQVLLSARRRLPDLKMAVVTGAASDQYRARAYEAGIDLFVEKPTTPAEFRLFGECVEALLQKGDKNRGFRGIQDKSLMDLVQFECLSQKSSALKITSGSLEGFMWFANGHVVDAEAQGMRGEEAFKRIFAWRAGNFELMPGNPERERTIYNSYESLLLESAQTMDEAAAEEKPEDKARDITTLATVRGVEWLLLIGEDGKAESWQLDQPDRFAAWTRRVLRDFQGVGDIMKAGPLRAVQAAGRERGLVVLPHGGCQLMAAMDRKMTVKFLRKAGRDLAKLLGEDIVEYALKLQITEQAQFPCGSYTVGTAGKVVVSTLPPSFPRVIMELIGKVFVSTLAAARELECPLTELAADFPGVEVRTRAVEGGAIIFITPQEYNNSGPSDGTEA